MANRKKEDVMIKCYINGWQYGYEYFCSIGRFTEREWERLKTGEIIVKNDNEFWVKIR